MFGLPFFNKYPYTNFEQLNLDWLMEKVGHFDARITAVEERATSLEGRMDTAEGDIDALEGRMDTAEGDIDALEGRMDTAEGDIDALEGRMDTAEGDIDALEGRMDTAEGDIDALEGRMDTAEGDIDALETTVGNIPVVIANPGGSGATLSTLKVNNTVYEIPSGGGGGAEVSIIGFDDDHLSANTWFIDPTDVSKIPDLYNINKIVYMHDLLTDKYYVRTSIGESDDTLSYEVEFDTYNVIHHVDPSPEYREEVMESIKVSINKTTGVLTFDQMTIRDETLIVINDFYYTFTVNNFDFDSTTTFAHHYSSDDLDFMRIELSTPVTILCAETTPNTPYYIFRDAGAYWLVNNKYIRTFSCTVNENGVNVTKLIECEFDLSTTPPTFTMRGIT